MKAADVSRRPRRWRVLTQAITVSYPADITYEDDAGEEKGAIGQTRIDVQTVEIALDQSPDKLAETEVHEMLHLCFNFAGLQMEHDDVQETFVKRMAPVLLSALRENPRLVEQWLGRRILGKGSVL